MILLKIERIVETVHCPNSEEKGQDLRQTLAISIGLPPASGPVADLRRRSPEKGKEMALDRPEQS